MTEALAGFRLSAQQAHLWRLGEQGGASPYRAQCLVEVAGPLDRAALAAALAGLAAEHELLRTAFRLLPGMAAPLQVPGEPAPPTFEERDLAALGDGPAAAEVEALWAAALAAPADPGAPPLARWWLLRLAPERHLLLLSAPALLADAAGLDNLVAGLVRRYADEVAPPAAKEAGEPPLQYVDLAEWQHELLDSEETREGRDYWLRQAPASEGPAELPLARAAGAEAPFAPRAVPVPLPDGLLEEVAALAAAAGLPAHEVLFAAWQALLWRLSGGTARVLGVAYDGRKFAELREAPGLFARTLPVPVRLGEELPFRDALARLHADLAERHEWQEYFAWDRLPEPEAGAGPPFLPLAGERLAPPPVRRAAGASFAVRQRHACWDRFLLQLSIDEREDGVAVAVRYDASRVDPGDAVLVAGRYAALLAAAVAAPDTPAGDLPVVGERERERLLRDWNDTAAELAGERLLHRLVEARAALAPGRTAVEAEGRSLTYAELDGLAGRLAARLARLGVGPDVPVAVCLERSPELVVALLAVLKAGGAWLPLDPSHPLDRLGALLDEARPAVLLLGEGSPSGLVRPGVKNLDLRRLAAAGAEPPAADPGPGLDPGPALTPDHLAYVIYTSGSTGKPKGVMVPHRAIVNRLLWMRDAFPLGPDDAVLQKTPASFDASIWELFLPLLAGARLVLARPGGHRDAAYLARAVAERGITVLQLVPSLLGPFLAEEGIAGCRGLLRLFCGGEALAAELAGRAAALLPGAALCNLYGPTETAIDATCHRFSPDDGASAGVVPIGRPLANVRVHLLDRRGGLVPQGAAGEVQVGGPGLARGYLDRPDLTAERFVPDPFADSLTGPGREPGARLYRTGDLARRRPDGALEFLGRIDQQVKVRGHRIELAEIEAWLARHPEVGEAVVAAREDAPGERRLVAYFTREAGAEPTADELRAFLAVKLPEVMVPSAFVELAALPRLASGKVDRAALPAPEREAGDGYVAPRTPTEQVLADRWAEVLGVERLGAFDNVYGLGWHSLLATQFVSRLRRVFGVELPLRQLFEFPTVAALAERIDAALRGDPALEPPPIARLPRDRPLPLSFAQQRLWFLDRLEPGSPFYNLPMALRFTGPLDLPALVRSLAEVRRRHESLRTTFAEEEAGPEQRIAPPGPVPLPLADLAALPDGPQRRERRRLIARAAALPFDLGRGPLLRALLLRTGEAEHLGLLTLHHIVSDGWSTGILVREVAAGYAAFVAGAAPALPEPPIQYADFAAWQRGWLAGEALDAQIAYWRRQLDGAPPALELPTDRPRPVTQRFRGALTTRLLPPETLAAVRELGRAQGATPFMVALAAGQALLGWTAGQDDVVVGTDVAGRNRPETEGVIGFFINQLPLRTRLGGDPTFVELLARVREVTLGAYAHQDLPFDKLVEVLRPERTLARAPVFQAKINLANVPPAALELPGLSIVPVEVPRETAQFDWILNLYEDEQGLVESVEYDTDLFDEATIDRMLGNYEALLAAVLARPEARLSELAEVLEESDSRQRVAAQEGQRQTLRDRLKRARRPVPAEAPAPGATEVPS